MKKLYSNKISKLDRMLFDAYLNGLNDGGGVEHSQKDESEAYFIIKWAKENNITLPLKIKNIGKWDQEEEYESE